MLGLGKNNSNKWMAGILPAYITTGPLATLIPLYLISIGGSVLDVSYAITLASAITIPAVIFWGYIADYYNRRKTLIVMSYLATTLLLASLFFIKNPIGIITIYTAIAFASAASAVPMNLLVIEKARESKWANNFAFLQMLMNLGTSIGLAVAWLWAGVFGLRMLILVLTIPSLLSAIIAQKLIKEPPFRIRAAISSVSNKFFSLVYDLVALPNFIMSIPSKEHFKSISRLFSFKKIIGPERRFVKIFYVISFLFFFGTALVNTEYPVALKLGGLSEASIFFIYLASISIQGVIFYYYGKLTENSDKRTISRGVLLLRATSYVFMGLSLLFVKGPFFFIDNLLLYVIGAGIAYGIYYPTTYLIFFGTIRKSNKGATLGTYSAVVGAGTLFGALASGIISVSYGFSAAFMSAGALMLVCIYVFAILPRK